MLPSKDINARRIGDLSLFSTKVTSQTKEAVDMLDESAQVANEVVIKAEKNVKLIHSAIIEKIGVISSLSRSNEQSVEEIAVASEHLSKLAEALSQALSQFKTL